MSKTEGLEVRPIGVVHSPYTEKMSAPRQPAAARGEIGTIELYPTPGMEHAVCDLDGCDHLWIVFWFHLAHDFRPKVLPPRSAVRRGVLATRSPHRPNPIGLSVVRLDRVDGLTLHIRDVDMLDGTPVLDVKPYVAYTDSVPAAKVAWLGGLAAGGGDGLAPVDPEPGYEVKFEPEAERVLAFVRTELGLDLGRAITAVLSLGPQPHPYRRIRKVADGFVLAVKEWRARFVVEGRSVRVSAIDSGYRPRELAGAAEEGGHLAVHRAVWERFAKRA
jgi:tRNA (adenine37-N6)-methyltransferase